MINGRILVIFFLTMLIFPAIGILKLNCVDRSRTCQLLAKEGRCDSTFVMAKCLVSCGICHQANGTFENDPIGVPDSDYASILNRQTELMAKMTQRIASGDHANSNEFPFFVSVTVVEFDGSKTCGGALIQDPSGYNEPYAVSAAHCVVLRDQSIASSRITVIAGVKSDNDWSKAVYYKVTNYIHHKEYKSETTARNSPDLVVLKLEKIEGTIDENFVSPIRITKLSEPTKNCRMIGAGMTSKGTVSKTVQSTVLDWFSHVSEYNWQTSEKSCVGDSGGPIICYEYDNNGQSSYALHGTIVGGSDKESCSKTPESHLSYFTKIGKFTDLITDFTTCNAKKICSRL